MKVIFLDFDGLEYKSRGEEILTYLKDNPSITNYVIVDDDIFDITPYFNKDNIVECNGAKGLTNDTVSEIINKIKK